jgi:hypothetical protein
MDEDFVDRRPGDIEMYRRLDAFAQVRLAPDAAAMARIRSALMGQALAMADARAASMTFPMQQPSIVVERPSLSALRMPVTRGSAAFLAACLTLGIVAGSVTASAAGGPLYGPRLWLEEANLPRTAWARAEAQLERLDDRLGEIGVATANGNAGAAEAALNAYAEIVADLQAEALAEPAIGASILDDLARRQVVLIALLDTVPPQALDALQHALQQGANAVEVIGAEDGNPGDPVRRGGGGPATNDGGTGGGSGGGGGGTGAGGGSGTGGQGTQGDDGGSQGGGGQGTQGGSGDGGNPPGQQPDPTPKPPKPARTPREPAVKPTPAPPTPPSNPGVEPGSGGGGGQSNRQDESGGGSQGGD